MSLARAATLETSRHAEPEELAVDLAVAQLRGLTGAAKSNLPQSEIRCAWAQLPAARATVTRLAKKLMDADERRCDPARAPALPDALQIDPIDRNYELLQEAVHIPVDEGGKRHRVYWTTAMLKRALAEPDPQLSSLAAPLAQQPGPGRTAALVARKARMRAQLKASRAHDRAVRDWAVESGYVRAGALHSKAWQRVHQLERRIMTLPALTIGDLLIKARLVERYARDPDRLNLFAWRTLPGQLARSVRRDLPHILAKA